jgi:2-oxoisovalerate dehydrogenase E1 component alpha subunit
MLQRLSVAAQSLSAACITARSAPFAALRQLQTSVTSQAAASAAEEESMEFPGGRVPFTSALQFIGGAFDTSAKIPCYRTLDGTGKHIEEAVVPHELSQEQATRLYTAMAKLQVMDTICYDAQRQV